MLIARIASDDVLEQAYQWLCQKRSHYHFNGDVWQLRRWWTEKKAYIQKLLLAGQYRFRELRLIRGTDRDVEWWSSMDALVLKAIALVLGEHLKPHLSERCFHLAGTGGMKAAVREVSLHLGENNFVFRTDVKKYYASIDHNVLFGLIQKLVDDEAVLELIRLYLRRFVSDGGEYVDILQGISLGCPLSPLMGALYLKPLDDRMAELGCFYVRFMDDWVVLAPTRWKLRKAIKAVNEVMAKLQVEKHPDKTFIGRIALGFDFLGYWFSRQGLEVAKKTVDRMLVNVSRLYEQGADEFCIETYLKRWWRWVRSGVEPFLTSGERTCVTMVVKLDGASLHFSSNFTRHPKRAKLKRCLIVLKNPSIFHLRLPHHTKVEGYKSLREQKQPNPAKSFIR